MAKFIKVSYGNNWHAWVSVDAISMVEPRETDKPVGSKALVHLLNGSDTAYWVDQTVEEVMEMING